ncbi:uncharacterized protein LTHEOB_10241 [Lasiodiplodia theobromae]|uniref:uncharacterized protein n=1 Tax=Lasiodiplodia theobromae TaxID=45133 RepID=UPI0015C314CA|nr:uncharacterized protein LTHEOB_10241 [Lasiodiplodia theobromae]KAF4539309.1 hypothetical protein LTHEOB_10241 [Lasiodiplodia theobromae]
MTGFTVTSPMAGSFRKVKMPKLVNIPSLEEVRKAPRMPLDCARDRIYAAAKEIEKLETLVPYFSGVNNASYECYAPKSLAGLPDHLLHILIALVVDTDTDFDGKKKSVITDFLHKFEDLLYITLYHIRMLYHELYMDFSAGRLDPDMKFTDDLTAEEMIEHLYFHWSVLVDDELLATLDFAIRKEALMQFKINHNAHVFNINKYESESDFKSIEDSVRRGLNAIPFDEAQLLSSYKGLVPELPEHLANPCNADVLLHELRRRHHYDLYSLCQDHGIVPSYEIFDKTERADEIWCKNLYHHGPNVQEEDGDVSPLALDSPEIYIPKENLPRPIDFNKICNYLPYLEDDEDEEDEYESSLSDYEEEVDEEELDLADELGDFLDDKQAGIKKKKKTDPFAESFAQSFAPITPPKTNSFSSSNGYSSGGANSKKRARAPSPIDTDLANGRKRFRVSPESPRAPTPSPLTGLSSSSGMFVSPWSWYAKQHEERMHATQERDANIRTPEWPFSLPGDVIEKKQPKERMPVIQERNVNIRTPRWPFPSPSDVDEQEQSTTTFAAPAQNSFTFELPMRPMSVLPSPFPIRRGDPVITLPSETRAQHEHDMVMNGELMQQERDKALRALCGEETSEDEDDKESIASDSHIMFAMESYVGYKKYW